MQDGIEPAKEGEITIKLTQEMIAQSRVIAKGKRIRDLERLIHQYGGTPSKWVKKAARNLKLKENDMNITGMNTTESEDLKSN